jgi:hypothetical protein
VAPALKLEGQKFGMLLVKSFHGRDSRGRYVWNCRCDCGKEAAVRGNNLVEGTTKSCGHLQRDWARTGFPRKTHGLRNSVYWGLYSAAKRRAKNKGLEFSIKITDIVVPDFCPLLGIPLSKDLPGNRTLGSGSPTLDRKISTLGYTLNNIWVISFKANTMKSNASLEELELLTSNLRRELCATSC